MTYYLFKVCIQSRGECSVCNPCKCQQPWLPLANLASVSHLVCDTFCSLPQRSRTVSCQGPLSEPSRPVTLALYSTLNFCSVSGSRRYLSWFLAQLYLFGFLFLYFIYHCCMCKVECMHQSVNLHHRVQKIYILSTLFGNNFRLTENSHEWWKTYISSVKIHLLLTLCSICFIICVCAGMLMLTHSFLLSLPSM